MSRRPPLPAFAAAAIACLALVATGARADTPLPRAIGIVLDGDLADWRGQGLALPLLTPDASPAPDPARDHATARLAWDADGLLFAVEVADSSPSEAHIAAGAYLADSVELFLAADPARGENLQILLSPGTAPERPAPRAYIFDNRIEAHRALPSAAVWAVRPAATGYTAEARLPWASLGLRAEPGARLGTRLFVNNLDASGRQTRLAWQAAPAGLRFRPLILADTSAPETLAAPVAWLACDPAAALVRLHLRAPASSAGTAWTAVLGDTALPPLTLAARGPLAEATLDLPAGLPHGMLKLNSAAAALELSANPAALAADVLRRANTGWRVPLADKAAIAYARLAYPAHVFTGSAFPSPAFSNPEKLARLLGAAPALDTAWLDADGRIVARAERPGLYGARTEITAPGLSSPLVLEHIFHRLPEGATTPPQDDEQAARVFALSIQGSDATPAHAARLAERWWHRVRLAHGWSQPLETRVRLPVDLAARPGPRPLVLHLHGAGQNDEKFARDTLARLAAAAGDEPIIAYPLSRSSWRGPAVADLLDRLLAEHPIDPDRVYLIGFSMGGIGSWEVALDQPERFAAVVPIGGRSGSPADAARLRGTPVWVFNGADDPTTTTQEAQIMVEALRRAGGDPRFTLLTGKSHGDSQAAAYEHPGLWPWILSQHRSSPAPRP